MSGDLSPLGAAGDYDQPDPPMPPGEFRTRRVKSSGTEMSEEAKILASFVKELYWLASSRAPRTQQVQLGPSELGDPCDNKLVRRLAGLTPANHGRADGWAATLGTAGHAWLAEALQEYDSGRGRFLIEHGIEIPAPEDLGEEYNVKGTLDLFDRRLRTVIDHKFLGESTLEKLTDTGSPDMKYQTQLQVYGYGLALQGEQPEKVAVVAWPRVEASLSKLYVWVAPYDPARALAALERREQLLRATLARGSTELTELLTETPVRPSALCRYCPFYKPMATHVVDGCRGVDAPGPKA